MNITLSAIVLILLIRIIRFTLRTVNHYQINLEKKELKDKMKMILIYLVRFKSMGVDR